MLYRSEPHQPRPDPWLTLGLGGVAVGAAVEGPAGVQVAGPARVAPYLHGPAQGQQELQELRLHAGR